MRFIWTFVLLAVTALTSACSTQAPTEVAENPAETR